MNRKIIRFARGGKHRRLERQRIVGRRLSPQLLISEQAVQTQQAESGSTTPKQLAAQQKPHGQSLPLGSRAEGPTSAATAPAGSRITA